MSRLIILDTETTGLEVSQGHRIIEIGCTEMINRRLTGNNYHVYLNPERRVDDEAIEVHGITNQFLEDKPLFSKVVDDFLAYIEGAELIIHNAPFDVGFINHELRMLQGIRPRLDELCSVTDSLVLARTKHPGQRNSLDALCKRYGVDNSSRTYHGALLDAEILADVYLCLTGGQVSMQLSDTSDIDDEVVATLQRFGSDRKKLPVISADGQEICEHLKKLKEIDKASDGKCYWYQLEKQ